jgi:hypothetical protein
MPLYSQQFGQDGTQAASGPAPVANNSAPSPASSSILNYAAPQAPRSQSSTKLADKAPVSSSDLESSLHEVGDIIRINSNGAVRDAFSRLKSDVQVWLNTAKSRSLFMVWRRGMQSWREK